MADAAGVRQPVRWAERARPPRSRALPRAWRGAALLLAIALAAAAIAAATAWQLTERSAAERLLARIAAPLFEVDAAVAAALPSLAARPDGAPLPGYPVDVPIPAALHGAGAAEIAEHVLAETASRLYDEGFGIAAQEDAPRGGFFSDGSAFAWTIGRLSAGGRIVASAALGTVLTAWALLMLALLGISGWRACFNALGAAAAAGGGIALIAALALRGWADSNLAQAPDAYTRSTWAAILDAGDLLLANAAAVAGLGAVLLAAGAAAWFLQRRPAPPAR